MKIAIIGSRSIKKINHLAQYIPAEVSAIVSGGAVGVDQIARQFAISHGLPIEEYLPDYAQFGKRAPLIRNIDIIKAADLVLAFWDGSSRGTAFVVKKCRAMGVPVRLFRAAQG